MGKRKEGPGSGSKGKKPSSWSFWAIGSVVVLLASWSSLRKQASSKPAEIDPAEFKDERLDTIREAFFSEDGSYHFAKNGGAAKRNGSHKGHGFSNPEYWESRYSKSTQEHYDWYGTWNSESKIRIKPHVLSWMPAKVDTILNIGCGNSRLAEELLNDGYSDITSVDIAQSAIDKMTEKFKGRQGLRFMQMDATKMTFEDESFDVIFDKGTLDAMYTGAADLVKLAVGQVFRVLRPGGTFISLTFGHPNSRKELNYTSGVEGSPSGWEQFYTEMIVKDDEHELADKQTFWMYLMKKPLAGKQPTVKPS